MIKAGLVKTVMENEQGMNHLWVQVSPLGQVFHVRLLLELPAGMFRNKNLNGFPENDAQEIVISNPYITNDIVFELIISEPVACGTEQIQITGVYEDRDGNRMQIRHSIAVQLVSADEAGMLLIDEDVLDKVMQVGRHGGIPDEYDYVIYPPAKPYPYNAKESSTLEKKYRIDY